MASYVWRNEEINYCCDGYSFLSAWRLPVCEVFLSYLHFKFFVAPVLSVTVQYTLAEQVRFLLFGRVRYVQSVFHNIVQYFVFYILPVVRHVVLRLLGTPGK